MANPWHQRKFSGTSDLVINTNWNTQIRWTRHRSSILSCYTIEVNESADESEDSSDGESSDEIDCSDDEDKKNKEHKGNNFLLI